MIQTKLLNHATDLIVGLYITRGETICLYQDTFRVLMLQWFGLHALTIL
jgi:hypothetical protein|uniref:Uncharacterized protein n=1 Tax=Zea mays TaxID=4577 RepID=C0P372_MAIZE|nr:unknown [Zea mays]